MPAAAASPFDMSAIDRALKSHVRFGYDVNGNHHAHLCNTELRTAGRDYVVLMADFAVSSGVAPCTVEVADEDGLREAGIGAVHFVGGVAVDGRQATAQLLVTVPA